MIHQAFEEILEAVRRECVGLYGDRLVSLAVFGSVARGTMGPESDVDLLIVAEPLPRGRMARVREFEAVDRATIEVMVDAARGGVHTTLSPVFKTPREVERGSPLFLDMTDEARILVDRDGFLRSYLDGLASRLRALGAGRVRRGGGYYWILKAELRPGEEIVL